MIPARHEAVRPDQQTVEAMIADRRPFDEIEDYINEIQIPDLRRAALWLLAWSEQTPPDRRRVIIDALHATN